jgi:hypothetical protein
MATGMLVSLMVPAMLTTENRKICQYVMIGCKAGIVARNYYIGVRF